MTLRKNSSASFAWSSCFSRSPPTAVTLSAKIASTGKRCGGLIAFSFLKDKQQCTVCRTPILMSSHYLPINIVLQNLIERKYPTQFKAMKEA